MCRWLWIIIESGRAGNHSLRQHDRKSAARRFLAAHAAGVPLRQGSFGQRRVCSPFRKGHPASNRNARLSEAGSSTGSSNGMRTS